MLRPPFLPRTFRDLSGGVSSALDAPIVASQSGIPVLPAPLIVLCIMTNIMVIATPDAKA